MNLFIISLNPINSFSVLYEYQEEINININPIMYPNGSFVMLIVKEHTNANPRRIKNIFKKE